MIKNIKSEFEVNGVLYEIKLLNNVSPDVDETEPKTVKQFEVTAAMTGAHVLYFFQAFGKPALNPYNESDERHAIVKRGFASYVQAKKFQR